MCSLLCVYVYVCRCMCVCVCVCVYVYVCRRMCQSAVRMCTFQSVYTSQFYFYMCARALYYVYGVALICRLLQNIGPFCRI